MLIQGTRKRGRTELSWQRTVDRALVHRNAIAEVLLTDIVQLDRTSFEVAAQWSRSHRVYRPDQDGRHDPMLLLETVRQAGLALSHFGFGVPFEFKSVMHDVGFRTWPEAEPRALHAATNVSIQVQCENVVMRGDQLRSMTVVLAMSADGVHFATGSGTLELVAGAHLPGLAGAQRWPATDRRHDHLGTGPADRHALPGGFGLAAGRRGSGAGPVPAADSAQPSGLLRSPARPRARHVAAGRGLAGGRDTASERPHPFG